MPKYELEASVSQTIKKAVKKRAKFDDSGKRTAWPRITVKLNGVLVHENLELAKDFTTSAPMSSPLSAPDGPVHLQNHNNPIVFRNIWIVPGE